MAYTNVTIQTSFEREQAKGHALLKAELAFWQGEAERLQRELENIPAAVDQYDEVSVSYRGETVTLIRKPEESDG